MLHSDKAERKSRFGQAGKIGSEIFFELRIFLVLSRFPVLLFAVKQGRAFAGVFSLYVLGRLDDKFFRCHNLEPGQPLGIENKILVVAPLVCNSRKPRRIAGRFPPSEVPSPGESRAPGVFFGNPTRYPCCRASRLTAALPVRFFGKPRKSPERPAPRPIFKIRPETGNPFPNRRRGSLFGIAGLL